MTAVSHSVSSLLNGVSQQAPIARLSSQLEEQVDCHSNLVRGLSRRPPWNFLAKLAIGAAASAYDAAHVHSVNRDNVNRYTIVMRSGAIEVFDTRTGVAKTVHTPNGTAYLNCANPFDDIRVLTVEDYTFIVNRTIATGMTSEVAPSYAYGGTVSKMSELPAHDNSWVGKYAKVTANSDSAFGTFYTTHIGEGSGAGSIFQSYWTEIAKPGVLIAFDPATMPHALVSEADGSFTFKELDWKKREAGDELSIPPPSFVGRKITDIFFARRRFGFVTGTNIICSRSGGDYFNFWREKGGQILDTDPIDFRVESKRTAGGFHSVVEHNEEVLAFTRKGQFRFTSAMTTGVLSPNTFDIREVSSYNSSPLCRPAQVGDTLLFTHNVGDFARVHDFQIAPNKMSAEAPAVSDHVPEYIPKNIARLDGTPETKALFAVSKQDRTKLFVWSHLESNQDRAQSSWSYWNAPQGGSIRDFSMDEALVVAAVSHADGVYLYSLDLSPKPTDRACHYPVHLDRRLHEGNVAVAFAAGVSTFTFPLSYSGQAPYVVASIADPALGVADEVALTSTANPLQWTAPGDWTGKAFFVGVQYASWGELSEQFPPKANNHNSMDKTATDEGKLILQSMVWTLFETAQFAGGVFQKVDDQEFGLTGRIPFSGLPVDEAATTPSIPATPLIDIAGKLNNTRRKTSKVMQKINMRSTRAIIRFGSVGHYPFSITALRWHGNYTYKRQQI